MVAPFGGLAGDGTNMVPVRVEAKGRDWTDESNMLLAPGWGVL